MLTALKTIRSSQKSTRMLYLHELTSLTPNGIETDRPNSTLTLRKYKANVLVR